MSATEEAVLEEDDTLSSFDLGTLVVVCSLEDKPNLVDPYRDGFNSFRLGIRGKAVTSRL